MGRALVVNVSPRVVSFERTGFAVMPAIAMVCSAW